MITTNLSDFGQCEIRDAIKLLEALDKQGLPKNFCDEKVSIGYDINNGTVFFTNSCNQMAMLNNKNLERYYCTPCDHIKGFADELRADYKNTPNDWNDENIQYLVFTGILHSDEVELDDDGEILRD